MDIVSVVGLHGSPVDGDTIDSILKYSTQKVIAIIDGAAAAKFETLPVIKINGFYHNQSYSPYRNIALGLMMAIKHYPNFNWLCYSEYDVLFGSDFFKSILDQAERAGMWLVGSNTVGFQVGDPRAPDLSFIERNIVKGQFSSIYYSLGCCMFFHRDFIRQLLKIDFFDRFLNLTNYTSIPQYKGYDINEHLYPTLAHYYGGNSCSLSGWINGVWEGDKRFPLRWKPELEATGNYQHASILHPLKSPTNYWRVYFREKRKLENTHLTNF